MGGGRVGDGGGRVEGLGHGEEVEALAEGEPPLVERPTTRDVDYGQDPLQRRRQRLPRDFSNHRTIHASCVCAMCAVSAGRVRARSGATSYLGCGAEGVAVAAARPMNSMASAAMRTALETAYE